ncbi:MAG: hypothetical protein KF695_02285 [Simplicispira sp.]|nr:hypothetical protein [Simplicispira sp.]
MAVHLGISLRYTHGLGDLSPYFLALTRGVALATHCNICKRTWFAPRLICACQNRRMAWQPLDGGGVLRHWTSGRAVLPGTSISGEFAFGLIQLDGASNLYLGRVLGEAIRIEPNQRVRLLPAARDWVHPSQSCDFSIDLANA